MENKVVYEYEETIVIKLPSVHTKTGKEASRAVCRYHTGKEEIPLDEEVSQELQKTYYTLACNHIHKIRVLVWNDGTLSIKLPLE